MRKKPWREMQPLPCENCTCCEYVVRHKYLRYLICQKYKEISTVWDSRFYSKDTLNYSAFENLYKECNCKKNYPSIWTKLRFRWWAWLKYTEDKKYHRLED